MPLPPLRNPDSFDPRTRGSVGSSDVWDETTRAARRSGLAAAQELPASGPADLSEHADPALVALVERAVARALARHLPSSSAGLRESLAVGLRERLVGLLAEDEAPPRQAEEALAPQPPGDPPVHGRVPGPSPQPSPRPGPSRLPSEVAERIHSSLADVGADVEGMDEIRTRVLEMVGQHAAGEAAQELPVALRADLLKIDLLERRLAKLERALEATRAAAQRAATLPVHDPGIASIYRTVQGLAEHDALLEVKREMLVEVYQANLRLQRRVGYPG